jgi:adenylate cyclase
MTQHRILVVDDTPQNVKLLADLLSVKGYEVSTAANGEQALEKVATERPDLVLLDVMMPSRSGYDLCREIRARPQLAAMKVIMLSAKGGQADLRKGVDAGADLYITKPFSNRELLERIHELLAR